jgi:hypothetical protein
MVEYNKLINEAKMETVSELIEIKLDDIQEDTSKIAIIIPYRNNKYQSRDKQLALFIEYYHSFLPNLDIYVIEQSEDGKKLGKAALSALVLAAISKGVHSVDKASSELYDYADKPSRDRAIYNANRERQSMRSVARYANEFRNPEIRL